MKTLFVLLLAVAPVASAETLDAAEKFDRLVDKISNATHYTAEDLNCFATVDCGNAVMKAIRLRVAGQLTLTGLERRDLRAGAISKLQMMHAAEPDKAVREALSKMLALLLGEEA